MLLGLATNVNASAAFATDVPEVPTAVAGLRPGASIDRAAVAEAVLLTPNVAGGEVIAGVILTVSAGTSAFWFVAVEGAAVRGTVDTVAAGTPAVRSTEVNPPIWPLL